MFVFGSFLLCVIIVKTIQQTTINLFPSCAANEKIIQPLEMPNDVNVTFSVFPQTYGVTITPQVMQLSGLNQLSGQSTSISSFQANQSTLVCSLNLQQDGSFEIFYGNYTNLPPLNLEGIKLPASQTMSCFSCVFFSANEILIDCFQQGELNQAFDLWWVLNITQNQVQLVYNQTSYYSYNQLNGRNSIPISPLAGEPVSIWSYSNYNQLIDPTVSAIINIFMFNSTNQFALIMTLTQGFFNTTENLSLSGIQGSLGIVFISNLTNNLFLVTFASQVKLQSIFALSSALAIFSYQNPAQLSLLVFDSLGVQKLDFINYGLIDLTQLFSLSLGTNPVITNVFYNGFNMLFSCSGQNYFYSKNNLQWIFEAQQTVYLSNNTFLLLNYSIAQVLQINTAVLQIAACQQQAGNNFVVSYASLQTLNPQPLFNINILSVLSNFNSMQQIYLIGNCTDKYTYLPRDIIRYPFSQIQGPNLQFDQIFIYPDAVSKTKDTYDFSKKKALGKNLLIKGDKKSQVLKSEKDNTDKFGENIRQISMNINPVIFNRINQQSLKHDIETSILEKQIEAVQNPTGSLKSNNILTMKPIMMFQEGETILNQGLSLLYIVVGNKEFRELLVLTYNSNTVFAQICYQEVVIVDCGAQTAILKTGSYQVNNVTGIYYKSFFYVAATISSGDLFIMNARNESYNTSSMKMSLQIIDLQFQNQALYVVTSNQILVYQYLEGYSFFPTPYTIDQSLWNQLFPYSQTIFAPMYVLTSELYPQYLFVVSIETVAILTFQQNTFVLVQNIQLYENVLQVAININSLIVQYYTPQQGQCSFVYYSLLDVTQQLVSNTVSNLYQNVSQTFTADPFSDLIYFLVQIKNQYMIQVYRTGASALSAYLFQIPTGFSSLNSFQLFGLGQSLAFCIKQVSNQTLNFYYIPRERGLYIEFGSPISTKYLTTSYLTFNITNNLGSPSKVQQHEFSIINNQVKVMQTGYMKDLVYETSNITDEVNVIPLIQSNQWYYGSFLYYLPNFGLNLTFQLKNKVQEEPTTCKINSTVTTMYFTARTQQNQILLINTNNQLFLLNNDQSLNSTYNLTNSDIAECFYAEVLYDSNIIFAMCSALNARIQYQSIGIGKGACSGPLYITQIGQVSRVAITNSCLILQFQNQLQIYKVTQSSCSLTINTPSMKNITSISSFIVLPLNSQFAGNSICILYSSSAFNISFIQISLTNFNTLSSGSFIAFQNFNAFNNINESLQISLKEINLVQADILDLRYSILLINGVNLAYSQIQISFTVQGSLLSLNQNKIVYQQLYNSYGQELEYQLGSYQLGPTYFTIVQTNQVSYYLTIYQLANTSFIEPSLQSEIPISTLVGGAQLQAANSTSIIFSNSTEQDQILVFNAQNCTTLYLNAFPYVLAPVETNYTWQFFPYTIYLEDQYGVAIHLIILPFSGNGSGLAWWAILLICVGSIAVLSALIYFIKKKKKVEILVEDTPINSNYLTVDQYTSNLDAK